MSERAGILAAIVSSALGGTAVATTRYLTGTVDAVTLAAFRFGVAFVLVLPFAIIWFTEGFDTAHFQDAKALLDLLA